MLEQWEPSKYIMPEPFLEYFEPGDVRRRVAYNRPRKIRSYLNGTARIPINVAPELLRKKPAERYVNLSRTLRKTIGFIVASFPYEDPDTLEKRLTPVHLCTHFNHNGFNVVGPWFPSLGHPVMTSELPDDVKKGFVQESIFAMQERFDAVVIGMPTRKDGSGTDSIFMDEFLDSTAFSTYDCKDITFYLFRGNFGPDINVIADRDFFMTINEIEKCRRVNFEEYKRDAAKKQNGERYSLDVKHYLKHVFRRVLTA